MLLPIIAALLTYDVVVTLLFRLAGWRWVAVPELPLPLLGSAVVVVVSLRNNAAYARWWEARTLWGAVVNNSRSFTRALTTLMDDPSTVATLVRQQVAYVIALRGHLLRQPAGDALLPFLPPGAAAAMQNVANVPFAIQMGMARQLAAARAAQTIDSIRAGTLDGILADLANAQGGLERIKNTPMPRQYDQFPQVVTFLYCLLLPIGLVSDLGYATPVGSTVIGIMVLALDRIGRDLEDPFENRVHDIPMAAIARTIEIDLLGALGETALPSAIVPVGGVLR